MPGLSTEAIILARREIGEADRLLTLFSRQLGKQKAVAKGIRRLTSRMAAHLEPGRQVKIFLIETRGLSLVTQAETMELFIRPSSPLVRTQALFQILEAVNTLFDEGQKDSTAYDLLKNTLALVDKTTQPGLLSTGFVVQMLGRQGYSPELDSCLTCQLPLTKTDESLIFSSSRGGLLHRKCGSMAAGNTQISVDAVNLLRSLQGNQTVTREAEGLVLEEVTQVVNSFFEWTTNRNYKSARLTDKLTAIES